MHQNLPNKMIKTKMNEDAPHTTTRSSRQQELPSLHRHVERHPEEKNTRKKNPKKKRENNYTKTKTSTTAQINQNSTKTQLHTRKQKKNSSRKKNTHPHTYLMTARAASRNFPLFTATSNAIKWVSINAPACALNSATRCAASTNGSFSSNVIPKGSSSTGIAAAAALPLRLLWPPFFSFSSAASSAFLDAPLAISLASAA